MGCLVCSILERKKYLQNWILCINMLGKKKLLLFLVLLLGYDIFCMPKTIGFMLASILIQFWIWCSLLFISIPKNMVQFITIFHLINEGWLMFKFESIKELFCILIIKNIGQMVMDCQQLKNAYYCFSFYQGCYARG
jgi:hypothetical protein